MSDTLELSKTVKKTRSTPQRPTASKGNDLQLVAERLALIQGHISQMPSFCISGAVIMDGFLLVALKVEGHDLSVSGGVWKLDNNDVTDY